MKLYIDLQDYKELIDIEKELPNKTSYKICRILHYVFIALSFLSIIIGLCSFITSTTEGLVFSLLGFISFAIGMVLCLVIDRYRGAFNHSLLIKDIKSPIEILNDSVNSDNRCFDFEYFDDNNILQSKSFVVDEIYTHKKDYYKIVGKFDENKNDYHFYLYEPYWPAFWPNSDKTDNKEKTHTNNVTININ